jgi:hypothetical protein
MRATARSVTLPEPIADETHDLAGPHVEIDAIGGPQLTRGLEGDGETAHARRGSAEHQRFTSRIGEGPSPVS